ncbi:hypothetical protein DKX38_012610 [Salix brachista]|uniref:RING-CH-type domain-containing protein n=1 Tax=Salix brachista TaxID=2182728 RepID=A0A5N5LPH2_9ROSI|nr:hypothetical protein DKX38_012610 [Salix brachista]
MSDHVVLDVDRLIKPPVTEESVQAIVKEADAGPSCSRENEGTDGRVSGEEGEEEPLIQGGECRICQEEDSVSNLETPCACSGSLKYAHRKCVQHWCNEKGDITCEICHQPYQPGYTAPPRPPHSEDTAIDFGGGWTISGTQLDLRDPRLLAIAEAERHFIEAEYDDYATSNAGGAAFCRSVALILMALLLLRHALTLTDSDADDDVSTFFSVSGIDISIYSMIMMIIISSLLGVYLILRFRLSNEPVDHPQLFLLRAAGFLLPCYIMAWAISILQRRRQRQEAAALAATQVAFVLQSGQQRGLQFSIAPGPSVTPLQEPV